MNSRYQTIKESVIGNTGVRPFKKLNHGKYIKDAQLKVRLFQHMFLPDDIKAFADGIASNL